MRLAPVMLAILGLTLGIPTGPNIGHSRDNLDLLLGIAHPNWALYQMQDEANMSLTLITVILGLMPVIRFIK